MSVKITILLGSEKSELIILPMPPCQKNNFTPLQYRMEMRIYISMHNLINNLPQLTSHNMWKKV